MRVELIEGACLVSRPKGAPRIGRESTFWYALQRELNRAVTRPALRWYRIRPHKTPGCLTGMPFALRQGRKDGGALIYDGYYALRDPAKQYNDGLTVRLARS